MQMEKLKQMIEQFTTGIKNKFGLFGSSAGKHQMAPIFLIK
jgi:hypothetical protein